MEEPGHVYLSRRERQIMDIIYASGKASAAEVVERLPDPPTRTAVRTLLRILEDKGP
jgi:predicted transcriptional regulator